MYLYIKKSILTCKVLLKKLVERGIYLKTEQSVTENQNCTESVSGCLEVSLADDICNTPKQARE